MICRHSLSFQVLNQLYGFQLSRSSYRSAEEAFKSKIVVKSKKGVVMSRDPERVAHSKEYSVCRIL